MQRIPQARGSSDRLALVLAALGTVALRPGPVGAAASSLADGVRDALTRDPLLASTAIVAASAAVFLRAERGVNPKVRSYGDALVYCSTSMSVGYHDIFPKTEVGKLVATFLMTVGPALAARALDAPRR